MVKFFWLTLLRSVGRYRKWIVITLALLSVIVGGLIGRDAAVSQRHAAISGAYRQCLARSNKPEDCLQAFRKRYAKNESDAHLSAAATGAITAAILAWLIVRNRCWRIGIVLLVLALLVGPVGKVIHQHARQVSFLQDCLLKAEHETIDYCAENYGVPLWAFDAVLILFMLLGACLIVVYVRTSRCQ